MADAVERFGLASYIQKPAVFCPISYSRWKDIIDPDCPLVFTEQTYAVHLWNEMWRRSGFEKDDEYDRGCLYEQLKAKYLGPSPAGRALKGWRGPIARDDGPVANPIENRSSWLPDVSAAVLTKNGGSRLARCLESVQRSRFADEIVVCVDADTTDDSFRIAQRFTPLVHVVATAGYFESALEKMISFCSKEFVLRLDDDECLDGNWDKESFQMLASANKFTKVWTPRRWIVPPGDSFIDSNPWFPNLELRLFANDPDKLTWPTRVHDQIGVMGRSLVFFDRWINHYSFVDRPRGERRRRCDKYRELNPQHDLSYLYLYEGLDYTTRPCGTTAIEAAVPLDSYRVVGGNDYPLGSIIDFSTEGTAMDYTGNGWGEPEGWGAWTLGEQAAICVPLAAPLSSGAILSVKVMPFLTPIHPTLHVRVLYGEALITEWSLDSAGFVDLTVDIGADLIAGDFSPSFTFQIVDPRSPAETGESTDSRFLGLAGCGKTL
jgi:hypothetical protein